MTPPVALRTAALLLLVLGVARGAGGFLLAIWASHPADTFRVGRDVMLALGAGLIAMAVTAVVASIGLMRCRVWGWALGFLAIVFFVADGLVNGYLLFGRPGDRGTMVNAAAAALILFCLLRGRRALERAPRTAPSA
ncbi:MAG TPA: hypothetical protein VGQ14_05385 [Candidatus Eisenbacteria bacterium]|nr:hypothetical protein [Candidatus Eisenbacteria bacterium]